MLAEWLCEASQGDLFPVGAKTCAAEYLDLRAASQGNLFPVRAKTCESEESHVHVQGSGSIFSELTRQ